MVSPQFRLVNDVVGMCVESRLIRKEMKLGRVCFLMKNKRGKLVPVCCCLMVFMCLYTFEVY